MRSSPACARTLAVEIGPDPGVRVVDDALQRVRFHAPVHDHPDTIAGTEDAVQIMGDHDDGEPQLFLQVQHQLIERGRTHRIEARGGLIEKQQARIERQGAGQSCALHHAPGELGRVLAGRLGGQPDEADPQQRQLLQRRALELEVLDHGQLHVLQHRQSRVQGAGLESDAVVRLDGAQLRPAHARDVAAVDAHHPGDRALQSEDGPQQHRLAGAGAADDAEHLVGAHFHVEPVVHHLGPEAVHQPLHLQHRVQPQMSISMNSTANSASASITQKIACTTATVTRRPSSRADPRTCMPR